MTHGRLRISSANTVIGVSVNALQSTVIDKVIEKLDALPEHHETGEHRHLALDMQSLQGLQRKDSYDQHDSIIIGRITELFNEGEFVIVVFIMTHKMMVADGINEELTGLVEECFREAAEVHKDRVSMGAVIHNNDVDFIPAADNGFTDLMKGLFNEGDDTSPAEKSGEES